MWLVIFNHKEVRHDTRRILGDPDPLSGHKSWGRLCILFEKVPERRHPACPHRLCSRGHGGGIGVEFADPGHGAGCRSGQAGVFPGGGGFLAGDPVFAAAGPSHPASAPEQFAGRRAKKPAPAHHHDGSGGDAAQHPGGYGSGRSLRRIPCRDRSDHCRRGAGAFPWHCHPELPGGCHHLHAPAGGGDEGRRG